METTFNSQFMDQARMEASAFCPRLLEHGRLVQDPAIHSGQWPGPSKETSDAALLYASQELVRIVRYIDLEARLHRWNVARARRVAWNVILPRLSTCLLNLHLTLQQL
jgi:hypothetical protein